MSDAPQPAIEYNRRALFWICVLALFTAAVAFSLRTAASGAIKAAIFDPIDPANSGRLIGDALGAAFAGFALALLIVSPILDLLGAKRVLLVASFCFVAGPLLMVFAPALGGTAHGGDLVYWGMALTGIGWGCTEGSINPVTAALYPKDKTKRLNMLHAWWPAGIIVGGLASVLLFQQWNIDWRIAIALITLPGLLLGLWTLTEKFPKTESSTMGVGFASMIGEPFKHPTFWIFFVIMFLTASTELAPGSWVDITLTRTVHMPGILVLVYVSAIMFVMRHFAGPLSHRFSDMGLLWFATIPATIGLYLLSVAYSPVTALVAATVWAFGVCFMWPTMLAAVAHRYPRGGSWTIGLVGFAGAMAIRFVLPELGAIYDKAKIAHAGGERAFMALQPGPHLSDVLAYAASTSFQTVAIIPVVLFFIFGLVWWAERKGQFGGKRAPAPAE
jgi:MFS family permease